MSVDATEERILDVAQGLMQTLGYPAFSYNDVATKLGLTKPAVHYHFGSKADLGLAVTRRYRAVFTNSLAEIDRTETNALRRLDRYVSLFAASLEAGRVCLCGLLAADDRNIPDAIRTEVAAFFDDQQTWLQRTLKSIGLTAATASRRAEALLAGLEGALIIAAARRDDSIFTRSSTELVRAAILKLPQSPNT
jgi:TetR/AcrR family transcriptional regulator, transcriptional repressor for nem operon